MISISKIPNDVPYTLFKNYYDLAIKSKQESIEAIAISSLNHTSREVESRMVNLKYINNNEWIFFSNFNSLKARNFSEHNQISALFFWSSINVQIRMKAKIVKTSSNFSDEHYKNRTTEKNALAHSSMQSEKIASYDLVIQNYHKALESSKEVLIRPANWGGYSFTPYYFEFWEGHESRLNKRDVYEISEGNWIHTILQP